jgi:hypothetical protein
LLLFALLQRIPAQTRQGYAEYWWNTHRVLADQEVPAEFAMPGYLHNYVDAADPCAWDGIGEIYEASVDAARTRTTWVEGPGGQVIRDDEDNFLRKDTRRVYVTAQHVVVPVTSVTMV